MIAYLFVCAVVALVPFVVVVLCVVCTSHASHLAVDRSLFCVFLFFIVDCLHAVLFVAYSVRILL